MYSAGDQIAASPDELISLQEEITKLKTEIANLKDELGRTSNRNQILENIVNNIEHQISRAKNK